MSINFEGLITDVTGRYITIVDADTLGKIRNVLKHEKYKGYKTPFTEEGYRVKLQVRTSITSAYGKEDISCLPEIVGWRCTGKARLKHWSIRSTYSENRGELIQGVTLVCSKIHLGT
jgi:hypothetical protein